MECKGERVFSIINKAFGEALVLASLDYQKLFLIFSFASPNTSIDFLLQKNDEEK